MHLRNDSLTAIQIYLSLVYNISPSQITATITPVFLNLNRFTAHFDPTLKINNQRGLVDSDGAFIINGEGPVITKNPTQIATLLANSTPFPIGDFGSTTLGNLLCYTNDYNAIYYIDSSSRYAVIRGQATSPFFIPSTSSSYFSLFPASFASGIIPSNTPYDVAKCWDGFWWGCKSAPKKLYTLSDPNCPTCHDLYTGLKSYVESGQVAVHWSMIGLVKPNSRNKAWQITDAKCPEKAFIYNEENFDTTTEEGGLPGIDNPSKKAIDTFSDNSVQFCIWDNFGIPYSVYKNSLDQTFIQLATPNDFQFLVDNIRSDRGDDSSSSSTDC